MNLLVRRFKNLELNERAFTEEDFTRACRRERIKLVEYPLTASPGFYIVCKGCHFITLDSRLRGLRRLHVGLHELAHYFLHVAPHVTAAHYFRLRPNTKEEFEADAFASLALIPELMLRRLLTMPPEEWPHGITQDMIEFRLKVLDTYKI